MQGEPIRALNEGLRTFHRDVMRDTQAILSVETAIISFGNGGVQQIQDFVGIDQFVPPTLEADGLTPMGEAIELALDLVEQRKQLYRMHGLQKFRPWVFLITDGAPTDEWQNAALRIKQEEEAKLVLFFAVGVKGADMQTLRQIAGQNPPALLNGLDFRDLFKWLSTSLKRVSNSKVGEAIALPPMSWGQITT